MFRAHRSSCCWRNLSMPRPARLIPGPARGFAPVTGEASIALFYRYIFEGSAELSKNFAAAAYHSSEQRERGSAARRPLTPASQPPNPRPPSPTTGWICGLWRPAASAMCGLLATGPQYKTALRRIIITRHVTPRATPASRVF